MGGIHLTIGSRGKREKLRRLIFAGNEASEYVLTADQTIEAIFRHVLDVADNNSSDPAQTPSCIPSGYLIIFMLDIQNIKGGE